MCNTFCNVYGIPPMEITIDSICSSFLQRAS